MPNSGTVDTAVGKQGAGSGTITVSSYIVANTGGTLGAGTVITGLSANSLTNVGTITQTFTASAANVFASGDYLRGAWSQSSGVSTGGVWSLRVRMP
jgi:hypothetical protein